MSVCAQAPHPPVMTTDYFDGIYIGSAVGIQNIFGGAFIDHLDVLAQKSAFVLDLSIGYRKQLIQKRIVLGVEFLYGWTDGQLENTDLRNQILINYENQTQIGAGLQLGATFGKRKQILLYLFGQQARRKFDITFLTPDGILHQQKDTQNFARLGFAMELPIYKNFNLRTQIAKTFVNFGDLATNMQVDQHLDYMLGFLIHF